jgi:hypothetical protein
MSTFLNLMLAGLAGALGVLAAVVLWQKRQAKPALRLDELSPQTLARAEEYVAAGKIVLAVKVVHDATGWPPRECKPVIDHLRAKHAKKG